ncbi:MAG: hypothetical protein GY786_20430, partial [Proteobacteria bacterium]|nr:hypothetical protein [Pseudomonadota bacterium]
NGTTSQFIASDKSIIADDLFFDQENIDVLISREFSGLVVNSDVKLVQSYRSSHQGLIKVQKGETVPWQFKKGYGKDGWLAVKGKIYLGNWSEPTYDLQLCNYSAQRRNIEIVSKVETQKLLLHEKNDCQIMSIAVERYDRINWKITEGQGDDSGKTSPVGSPLGIKSEFIEKY